MAYCSLAARHLCTEIGSRTPRGWEEQKESAGRVASVHCSHFEPVVWISSPSNGEHFALNSTTVLDAECAAPRCVLAAFTINGQASVESNGMIGLEAAHLELVIHLNAIGRQELQVHFCTSTDSTEPAGVLLAECTISQLVSSKVVVMVGIGTGLPMHTTDRWIVVCIRM